MRRCRKVVALVALVAVAGGLSVTSVSTGAVASAEPAAGDPIGNVDSISVRMAPLNSTYRYEVFGWAADPDAPGGPVTVHIYVDGVFRNALLASEPRPDVEAAFAWAGPGAGFSTTVWSLGLTGTDPHVVCAYAINVGAGANNTTLGCLGYPGGGDPAGNPFGVVDELSVQPGLVHVRGWAGDPDGGGVPLDVRVYYDGTATVQPLADDSRPDVAAVFPQLRGTTGFDELLPIVPGVHEVCVYAGNIGREGADNATLGCATVDVPGVPDAGPGDPLGSHDRTQRWGSITTGVAYEADGWTFDSDAAEPWVVRLRLLAANPVTGAVPRPRTIDGITGEPRPDVEAVFPAAGPSSGWKIVATPGMGKYGIIALICAYAVNVGPGSAPERLLRCQVLPP